MSNLKCGTCKAPIFWLPTAGCYVHDQTLAELRVTPHEVQEVHWNALSNATLPPHQRRYNALHQVKPAGALASYG